MIGRWLLLVCCLLCSGCGEKTDGSRFTSARLLADDNTVVFSAQRLVYRRASGMAAYPDGGMPDYLANETVVGRYAIDARTVLATATLDNDAWIGGQGQPVVLDARGDWVLLRRSGQRRDTLQNLTEHRLLRGVEFADAGLDLDRYMATAGLELAEVRLLDDRGTVLAVGSVPDGTTLVLTRLADGTWRPSVAGQYQGEHDGEVFVWQAGRVFAYDPVRDARRPVPANAVPPPPEPSVGVTCTPARLEYGVRTDRGWQYAPLPLTLAAALG